MIDVLDYFLHDCPRRLLLNRLRTAILLSKLLEEFAKLLHPPAFALR